MVAVGKLHVLNLRILEPFHVAAPNAFGALLHLGNTPLTLFPSELPGRRSAAFTPLQRTPVSPVSNSRGRLDGSVVEAA